MLNELMSIVSLALIAVFLFYPYNSLRVDKVRQSLFALRDEMFDDATQGKIRFDSEAYRATRVLLNGAIRFAHQISFARIIAYNLLVNTHPIRDGLQKAMDASPAVDRELCKSYIERADVLVFQYVFSSPFVLVIVVPHLTVVVLKEIGIDVGAWFVGVCKNQFADFNRRAFEEGRI